MRRLLLSTLVVGLLIGSAPMAASTNDSPIAQQTGDITRPIDELWADIGEMVPEFGGFFHSQEQHAVMIHVTARRPGIAAELRNALETVFNQASLDGLYLDNIVLLDARYSMLQLIEWRDRMRQGSMMSVRCVTSIGFEDFKNQLHVRVEGLGAKPSVENKLDELGIPREAVIIKHGFVLQLLGGTSPHQSPDPSCAAPNKMGVVWWVGGAGALILAATVAKLLFARRAQPSSLRTSG